MQAGADESNVRNFKDFLLLYNRLTETCFNVCATNFNYRSLTENEESCINACSTRFIHFNQRLMGTFVEAQSRKQNDEAEKQQQEMKEKLGQIEMLANLDPSTLTTPEATQSYDKLQELSKLDPAKLTQQNVADSMVELEKLAKFTQQESSNSDDKKT